MHTIPIRHAVTAHSSRSVLGIMATVLLVFQGLGAVGGGLALMLGPQGQIIPLSVSMLAGSAFSSYFVPGLILFAVLGLGPLAVAALAWRRHGWAPFLTLGVGLALLIWLSVQFMIVGYTSDPPIQAVYVGVGLVISVVGAAWWRQQVTRR